MTFGYPTVKTIIICGDIHGDFEYMVSKLCSQYNCRDTLLVVAGDCGFGFERQAYYITLYNRIAGKLKKCNNYVAFVRGNHDNPAYFAEEKVSHLRWRCVPDYSVIAACGHNILCIGGAISIDRMMRKAQEKTKSLKETGYYWATEAPVFTKQAIDEISVPIDTVVSHTAPSFCEKHDHSFLSVWAQNDPSLIEDVTEERRTMDQIYDYLKEKRMPIRRWYYGHFHQSWYSIIEGVMFRMLDCTEFLQLYEEEN